LLVGGAAFAATQPDRMWVAGVMLLTALLIAPFRACFYRHSYLFSGPLQPSTVLFLSVLIICLLSLAITRNQVQAVADQAWWAIVLAPGTPDSLRVTVALTVVLALIAIWHLLRPGRVRFLPWDAAARTRLLMFGARPPREADGIVLGESERAAIPFRRLNRVLLGIGDPAGAESDRVSAVWRLRDLARQEGLDPAFWHAGPDLLKVYADLGMTAVPLGKDGLPLPEAEDIAPASERYLVCVAERDLTLLVPLLPQLAAEAEFAVPAAAE
jgi:phosphatidylglycerol lysyltransferase